jgi:hypothetical protein
MQDTRSKIISMRAVASGETTSQGIGVTYSTVLEVTVTPDVVIDPALPGYDEHLVRDIKTAAREEWVNVRRQPPETTIELVSGTR